MFVLIFAVGLVFGVAITVAVGAVLPRRTEAVAPAHGLMSGLELLRTRVEKAESRVWILRDGRGESQEIAVNTVFAHRVVREHDEAR